MIARVPRNELTETLETVVDCWFAKRYYIKKVGVKNRLTVLRDKKATYKHRQICLENLCKTAST